MELLTDVDHPVSVSGAKGLVAGTGLCKMFGSRLTGTLGYLLGHCRVGLNGLYGSLLALRALGPASPVWFPLKGYRQVGSSLWLE